MPTYGPNFGSSASGSGSPDTWDNPTNVFANDGTWSTCDLEGSDQSELLEVTGFGFAVPGGDTILGIQVDIERSASVGSTVTDDTVQLVQGGAGKGSDKADLVTNWPTTDTVKTYGGAADLWGASWSPSDINLSAFGISIRCAASAATQARIDYVTITVTTSAGQFVASKMHDYRRRRVS